MRHGVFLACAVALALNIACPVARATTQDEAVLKQQLQRLADRLERVEKRNAALEAQLKAYVERPTSKDGGLERRIQALEGYNKRLEDALDTENISEREPELATRLKAVEYNTLDIKKQAKVIDSIEGFAAGASFTSVGQRASGVDTKGTTLNYRADITVTTPTVKTGDIESKLFGHFRVGQGRGIAPNLTSFVGPNASSFQLGTAIPPENSAVLLAQAYYRAEIPLPFGGFKPHSREKLTVNFGKMDPFAFFDQNAAANDETRQFLASPFVHNALLDNPMAANIGADGFGFSPGARVAYRNERSKNEPWGLSFGVFGAGRSTNFSEGFRSPFQIAQAETTRRFGGLTGNYRAFLWRNGQAPTFLRDPSDLNANLLRPHRGGGVNFDQRVDDYVTLFGRLGWASGDGLPFDRVLALGAEIGGSYWSRGADALGVAFGVNRSSEEFRNRSARVVDAAGRPVFGFAAHGAEQVAEIYYRFRVHQNFEISPDFQLIRDPAGNSAARPLKLVGIRIQLNQ
ncbi:MAG: carbohydrate porin [Betaproteobacteria bacterium]|nr:carbohydrate porin [Betaproteobacteria bacterium]